MNSTLFFTLINPAMSLIFAAAFFGLWRSERQKPYLSLFALTYVATTLGFVFQAFNWPADGSVTKLISNAMFLGGTMILGVALAGRYRQKPPLRIMGAAAAIAYGVLCWHLLVTPDIVIRIYAVNFGIAFIFATAAVVVYRSRPSLTVDWIVLAMLVVQALLMFGRTIYTVKFGAVSPTAGLQASTYWMVMTFTHAVTSLVLVFSILTGIVYEAMNSLRDATLTDPLSGLLNRRGFECFAKDAVDPAKRRGPVSLIFCDLDHFKAINDTHGHHIGDEVIVRFARTLKQVLDGAHVAGRLGGEEFAILVAGGDQATAELVAQGARVGFAANLGQSGASFVIPNVTASFGVAQLLDGENYESLASRADAALYSAKRAGRDCVRISRDRNEPANRDVRRRRRPALAR